MTSTAAPICFGDVVKFYAKAGDASKCVGFLERKGNEYLLVVPPVAEKEKEKFQEAEFIIAPTRCDKPPANGTPLNYKQPFTLVTSSKFEEYSLNNKMSSEDTIGLQCRDVKGEMYMTINKEGYTMEANVMSEDAELDVIIVDSNRQRKKYNKKLASYNKNKCEFVSCGSKGKPLSLKIVKVPDATTTAHFVKSKIERRRSTLTQAKADELGRANRVGSDVSDGDALSPTSAPAPVKEETPSGASEAEASASGTSGEPAEASAAAAAPATAASAEPSTAPEAAGSTASTAESTASAPEQPAASSAGSTPATSGAETASTPAASTTAAEAPSVPTADLLSEVMLEDKKGDEAPGAVTEAAPSSAAAASDAPKDAEAKEQAGKDGEASKPAAVMPTPAVGATVSTAAKPENKPAAPSVQPLAVPLSPKKLGQQPSAMTLTSEAEGAVGDDKLEEGNCLGGNKCTVM